MENQTEKKPSIGAWKKQTAAGKTYIQFTIEGKKYIMWENGYKSQPTHPDFKIYEDVPKSNFIVNKLMTKDE